MTLLESPTRMRRRKLTESMKAWSKFGATADEAGEGIHALSKR